MIGVLPPGITFPVFDELYVPFRWDESPRSARNINAVALLQPGESLERARDEIAGIAKRLEDTYPVTNRGYGVQVMPIRASYVDAGDRSHGRRPDDGGRLRAADHVREPRQPDAGARRRAAARAGCAIGHGRRPRPAAVGGARRKRAAGGARRSDRPAAVAVGDRLDDRAFPAGSLPYWFDVCVDWRVALFSIGVAIFTTLAVGVLPSLRAASPNLVNDLKEGGRGVSLGRGGQRLQAGLAVAQVALCFALLVGANLMVQSFLAMQRAEPRLRSQADRVGARLSGRRRLQRHASPVGVLQQGRRHAPRVAGCVGRRGHDRTPGDDGGDGRRLVIDGRTERDQTIDVQAIGISSGLFDTIGLPLHRRPHVHRSGNAEP